MPVGNIFQKLHLRLVAHSRPFSQSEEEEEERTLEDDDEEEAPDIVMTWNMAKYLPEDGSIQVGRHKHVQEAGAGCYEEFSVVDEKDFSNVKNKKQTWSWSKLANFIESFKKITTSELCTYHILCIFCYFSIFPSWIHMDPDS